MIRACSDVELELDALLLSDPFEAEARLRAYFLLIGGGAYDIGDALERAERGEEPHIRDLQDKEVEREFPRALADVRAERLRRDHRTADSLRCAAGLLAIARNRGQARKPEA